MEIETTRIFVKVIEFGSFSKAAIHLRLPKSTVSRAISRLERETNSKLLVRTTRALTLTASGQAFYDSCRGPIQVLEESIKSLDGRDSIVSGLVRLTAPEDLGNSVIATVLADLSRKHPMLRFEFLYSDKVVDLVRDGYDLAVRLGKLGDSALKVRRLGTVHLEPVAAPKYLRDSKPLTRPEDLVHHHCLSLAQSMRDDWTLRGKKGGSKRIRVNASISGNQMSSLISMAIMGAGVALVPSNLCSEALKTGKLVRVLPGWDGPEYPVWLISPQSTASIARVKVVADAIFEIVGGALR